MKKNYYVVSVGRTPGIYKTWEECKAQVEGFSGASFKGFATLDEAEAFLKRSGAVPESERNADSKVKAGFETGLSGEVSIDEAIAALPRNHAIAYVDGSFDIGTRRFSYGCIVFHDGQRRELSKALDDANLAEMRNVAGEIHGAMAAMDYCLYQGIDTVTIYHDYEGIAKWCTGEWKASKPGTIAYKEYYEKAALLMKVRFVKVKGHSGDKYNEQVDRLAKEALGIL